MAITADELVVPEVVLAIQTPGGLGGSATVGGAVHGLFRAPELDIRGDLAPLDLAMLAGVVPKVDRALGVLTGSLSIRGRASAPLVAGALHLKGGELAIRGLPSAITDLDLDVTADASEIRIALGTARFAGGAVRATGNIPITRDGFGRAKLDLAATDVHVAPADGVSATLPIFPACTARACVYGRDVSPRSSTSHIPVSESMSSNAQSRIGTI